MNIDDIENKFLAAFDSINADVKNARKELVDKIEGIISTIRDDYEKELLIVNTPESRIKHKDRFFAKFVRNNYVQKWGVNDNWTTNDYEKHLRENLSDLIGLRVVCYLKNN